MARGASAAARPASPHHLPRLSPPRPRPPGRLLRGADSAKAADAAKGADQYGGGWRGNQWGNPYGVNNNWNSGRWNNGGNWNQGGGNWGNQNNWNNGGNGWYRGGRHYRGRDWRTGDRGLLRGIAPLSQPQPYGPAPGPMTGDALAFSNTLASADAQAAASSMVGGQTDVIAQGIGGCPRGSLNRARPPARLLPASSAPRLAPCDAPWLTSGETLSDSLPPPPKRPAQSTPRPAAAATASATPSPPPPP